MKTQTKDNSGRTFSILNLTSSAKINKKKTSGAKITTTKELSETKDVSKIDIGSKMFTNICSSKIFVTSKRFLTLCLDIGSETILNRSSLRFVCKSLKFNKNGVSDCCWYKSS